MNEDEKKNNEKKDITDIENKDKVPENNVKNDGNKDNLEDKDLKNDKNNIKNDNIEKKEEKISNVKNTSKDENDEDKINNENDEDKINKKDENNVENKNLKENDDLKKNEEKNLKNDKKKDKNISKDENLNDKKNDDDDDFEENKENEEDLKNIRKINKKITEGKDDSNKKKKSHKFLIFSILAAIYFIYKILFDNRVNIEIYDKEFERLMLNGNVAKVICIRNTGMVSVIVNLEDIENSINTINNFRGYNILDNSKKSLIDNLNGIMSKKKVLSYHMMVPNLQIFDTNFKEIEKKLPEDQRIGYEVMEYSSWISLIPTLLSLFVTLLFVYLLLLQIGMIKGGKGGVGGVFGFGKSKAKLFDKNSKNKITFNDVAGLIEPKAECQEIIKLLKNRKKLLEIGGKMPKGMLFVGPPGNGKTYLAKAIAGECNANFLSLSGSDFSEMFYGVGSARVRALFEEAKEKAPAIIFIDEIDSIGKSRSRLNHSNDDQENTLNTLLVEMDGFNDNTDILIIGSTNRVDVLDQALLRPGRFDIKININKPIYKERIEILNYYLNKLKIKKEDINVERLAEQTVEFSAAEISNVCNEAALMATRNDKESIEWDDFQEAIDRVIGGIQKKSLKLVEHEKKIVAYHEAGHALASWYLKNAHPLLKVTIISRGDALGYAQYTPKEQFIRTQEELIDDLCTLLGGRTAEELIFNTKTTGAANDLERAHNLAVNIVTVFGMNEKIGTLSYLDVLRDNPYYMGKPFSEETAKIIDEEVKKIIEQCHERVKNLLIEKKDLLVKLAEELIIKEVILKDDIEKLIGPREPFFEN